jgi:hypothetical protein
MCLWLAARKLAEVANRNKERKTNQREQHKKLMVDRE